MIGERVSDLVQRSRQARLADDVRRPARQLTVEERRGGQAGGPDRALGHGEAGALEPGGQVTGREDRVVRQHQERPLLVHQALQELGGAGKRLFFADEHAVHIGEPALRC
jgi:hypothetical protein